MTSRLRILPAAALTVAALALPSGAHAYTTWSQTLGSDLDLSQVDGSITCEGCTFAMDTIGSQIYVDTEYAGDQMIVTSFRAKLAAGTTATLRSFTRGGYGAMTPVSTGETVEGTGQLETYESHLWVERNETIGLDLDGSIAAIKGTGTIRVLADGTPNGSESETNGYDLEPMLQATVEQDDDGDHLGDRTQDPCYYSCDAPPPPPASGGDDGSGASGSGGSYGGGSYGSGSSGSTSGSTGGDTDAPKGSPRSNENIRSGRVLTIQENGVVTRGRKPIATAYLYNPHNDSVSGTATLKVGGKVVAKTRAYSSTLDDLDFKLKPKVAKRLAKGVKGTVTANVSSDEHGKESDTFAVAFKPTVTTAFDGTYRAKGPIVVKVKNGLVETATASLFASSTNGSGSLTRAYFLPSGAPAIIGKDGTVEVHGHEGSGDEVRFKAAFKKNGTVKGYISLWYYQIGMSSSGRIQSTPFLGASNWVAKKG